MKNFFNKILCAVLIAAFSGVLTGCDPEPEKKDFSVSLKGFGPGYVTLNATIPYPVTVAYTVSKVEMESIPNMQWNETVLNISGTENTFYTDGEQQLLDYPIEENTKYYAAKYVAIQDRSVDILKLVQKNVQFVAG